MNAVLEQMERGAQRLQAKLTGRRQVTDGHRVTAQESRTMLGLMKNASALGSEMSDDQRIFLSQSSHGMRQRMAHLLTIPNRSLEEERELHMIDRGLADVEGRAPAPRPLLALPTLGGPWLAILASPLTWIALGAAWIAADGVRIERLHHELAQARSDVRALEHSRDAFAHDLAQERAAHARDVAGVLEQTSETVRQLEQRAARERAQRARERSRHEDLENGSVDFGQRLRELAHPSGDQLPANPAAAPSGGAASGLSASPGSDPHTQPPG